MECGNRHCKEYNYKSMGHCGTWNQRGNLNEECGGWLPYKESDIPTCDECGCIGNRDCNKTDNYPEDCTLDECMFCPCCQQGIR